jgi:hypothetical protein
MAKEQKSLTIQPGLINNHLMNTKTPQRVIPLN